jgi:CyaY protein
MDAALYASSVSSFFKKLVAAADAVDPDLIECDATGDMVTFTVPKSGTKVIVNTQRAVWQIWVAGKGEGVHFSRGADGKWMDDKGKGLELGAWVRECVKDASGVELGL